MSREGWDRADKELKKFTTCDGEVAVRSKICQDAGETLNITSDPITNPLITNLNMASAGVEYSHTFQSNVKSFMIKARNSAKVQFAYVATESTTDFITIDRGTAYRQEGLAASSLTIYLTSDKGATTLEILEWT